MNELDFWYFKEKNRIEYVIVYQNYYPKRAQIVTSNTWVDGFIFLDPLRERVDWHPRQLCLIDLICMFSLPFFPSKI